MPKELSNLTNLETLHLHGNAALEKPPECPLQLYEGKDMFYERKSDVAAFLRCLT